MPVFAGSPPPGVALGVATSWRVGPITVLVPADLVPPNGFAELLFVVSQVGRLGPGLILGLIRGPTHSVPNSYYERISRSRRPYVSIIIVIPRGREIRIVYAAYASKIIIHRRGTHLILVLVAAARRTSDRSSAASKGCKSAKAGEYQGLVSLRQPLRAELPLSVPKQSGRGGVGLVSPSSSTCSACGQGLCVQSVLRVCQECYCSLRGLPDVLGPGDALEGGAGERGHRDKTVVGVPGTRRRSLRYSRRPQGRRVDVGSDPYLLPQRLQRVVDTLLALVSLVQAIQTAPCKRPNL